MLARRTKASGGRIVARIRSIKPEFPQSETIGFLSRDARLLFIQLWTIADDEGRTRAASRMLASLLYPYDNDAGTLMEQWLEELEGKQCIRRYEVKGSKYLEIINWLKHQKIDKPSKSKIPPFAECSRSLANSSEASTTDLGPRTSTKDLGEEDAAPSAAAPMNDETEVYRRGKEILGTNSGGLIKNLIKAKSGSIPHARASIEIASTKQDPREYIGAIIQGTSPPDDARSRGDAW
jgi:hypothetical protein